MAWLVHFGIIYIVWGDSGVISSGTGTSCAGEGPIVAPFRFSVTAAEFRWGSGVKDIPFYKFGFA